MMRAVDRTSPWARLRWPVLALSLVLVYGITGYMSLEGWSFVDALYMTVITLTSVGYKEVRPLDTSGKLFTISLLIMGATLLLITLSLVAFSIAEGGLGRSRRKRMQRRIGRLRDHFIVGGYGRIGRTVARELEGERKEFLVVERDDSLEDAMIRDGVLYLIGDPTHEAIMRAAGVQDARALVSAVDSDGDNVFITLLARSLNPAIFIVARASEAASADRLYRAGADRVISPHVTSGRHMAMLALKPRVVDYLEVPSPEAPGMMLEEIQVDQASNLAGRTISDLSGPGIPLVVRRIGGEIVSNPSSGVRLELGDLIVVLGESDAMEQVKE